MKHTPIFYSPALFANFRCTQRCFQKRFQQAGFSLVELLIYMGLISIFMVVLTVMFLSILETQHESLSRSAVAQQGQFLMSRLAYDFAQATEVTTPATAGQQTTTLTLDQNGSTVAYELTSGSLTRTENSETLSLHSDDIQVESLQVTRLGGEGVTPSFRVVVTVSTTDASAAGERSATFTTTYGLR